MHFKIKAGTKLHILISLQCSTLVLKANMNASISKVLDQDLHLVCEPFNENCISSLSHINMACSP